MKSPPCCTSASVPSPTSLLGCHQPHSTSSSHATCPGQHRALPGLFGTWWAQLGCGKLQAAQGGPTRLRAACPGDGDAAAAAARVARFLPSQLDAFRGEPKHRTRQILSSKCLSTRLVSSKRRAPGSRWDYLCLKESLRARFVKAAGARVAVQ